MKQSGHLNPSEETETGSPVTSKYGRIPPNKHGGVGRQQQQDKSNPIGKRTIKRLYIYIYIIVIQNNLTNNLTNLQQIEPEVDG